MSKNTFQGGSNPDLSDLVSILYICLFIECLKLFNKIIIKAMYGSICSFKGCTAFEDMMKNTGIKNWYNAMQDQVENNKGSSKLNVVLNSDQDIKAVKKSNRFFFF
jgi:hypothetical protein